MNTQQSLQYFEIIRAMHRGGLSLWLNRRILIPMTLVPIIVTFLTLMVMRAYFPNGIEPSAFILALMQIPSDFVTGIFCALIIFIIMNAPKKADKSAPVMFSLNIMERKDLLLIGAVTHMAFGYFASGAMGAIQLLFEPIQEAGKAQQAASLFNIFGLFTIIGFLFYAVRFIVFPILIIGKIDFRIFYAQYRKVGFSVPIFLVKFITVTAATIAIYMMVSLLLGASGVDDNMTPTQMAIVDILTAIGSVLSTAWAYAALSIGVRQMLEGKS